MVAKFTAVALVAFGLAAAGGPAIPETAASAEHMRPNHVALVGCDVAVRRPLSA